MALQVGVEAQAVVPLALKAAVPVVLDGVVSPAGQQLGQYSPLARVVLQTITISETISPLMCFHWVYDIDLN